MKYDFDEKARIPVMEIFDSVQGEGMLMGKAVTFVRVNGCNLRCPWCDTKESWKLEDMDHSMTVEQITEKCTQPIVVITGGEPCMYPEIQELVYALKENNHYVSMETNGTHPTPLCVDWVTASPKPPEYKINKLCLFNELKFVVSSELDMDKHVMPLLYANNVPVWLQPNGYDLDNSSKIAYNLVMSYSEELLRLGIQMHKIFDFK